MDPCGNTGLINNDPHSTILLNTSIDRCTREITLDWTPYQNWSTGVVAHQVWLSKDGVFFGINSKSNNDNSNECEE